ncbi:MAG: ABC transporter ATP-binding protein [Deltaproteobacteria bacterium]|nr:ABC transporter ATP-binding protein [Deltaproteobacteria bacterium]
MELIRAENITFAYSRQPVLKNVSLTVHKGEVVSLLGPNGSGKTTLLKVLLGLYRPESGQVWLDGVKVSDLAPKELAGRVAYVPQFHKMAFGYRVLDVVLMGRLPHKSFFSRYSKVDMDIALQSLERLSISHLKDRIYTEISGGERQLTLIGRALAQEAKTLLMDEPANGLDYGNQIGLLERIAALAQEGFTFIKSTHFPEHALWIADRVIMLQHGVVVADGTPSEVMSDEAVSGLYHAEINIVGVNGGFQTCIPRAIMKAKI